MQHLNKKNFLYLLPGVIRTILLQVSSLTQDLLRGNCGKEFFYTINEIFNLAELEVRKQNVPRDILSASIRHPTCSF